MVILMEQGWAYGATITSAATKALSSPLEQTRAQGCRQQNSVKLMA